MAQGYNYSLAYAALGFIVLVVAYYLIDMYFGITAEMIMTVVIGLGILVFLAIMAAVLFGPKR